MRDFEDFIIPILMNLHAGHGSRIQLRAWMFSVCAYVCVFLCLCTGRPCDELITRSRSPTDCVRSRKPK
jgi:hypothetical protein